MGLLAKLFGDFNKREIKKLQKRIDEVNSHEETMKQLSDDELKNKTLEFRGRLEQGETLDDLLPEAFAVVREAASRTLGMRHFDVQILGGIVLHQGRIAEMKTGEGKTLVATLPAYLNALTGKGVHIITVNDYLASRDSEWMGQVYEFLGLEVGLIVHGISPEERRKAYAADIAFGTNNEFGFDYLRDNMAVYQEKLVQRELNYTIVDEVDSILVDEARTPLIISGQAEKSTELYGRCAAFVPRLKKEDDYVVEEKSNSVTLTEEGVAKAEKFLGLENLYDETNIEFSHHVNNALKANVLMKRDKDYVIKDGEVVIVDEFTGRLMVGRRYSDGLHQAIEAKEKLEVARESQTLASITFQNYFRMYKKIGGMTGTAATEEEEFQEIYGLDVVVIPTNKPLIREDFSDRVYKTEEVKFRAVVEDITQRHQKGQPQLVGTISIEKSEKLSDMLKKKGVPHQVLNAKHHEKEAEIIANAGQKGSVTIATNMAGRGTDIVLGEGVVELGGLHVIGTERHESRRIDNQLRGRSGRQGDPGSSQFYVGLDDDLMRLFGGDNIAGIMDKLGLEEDQPIDHGMVSKAIENAQKKVEGRNFDIRKHVLEYDDVMNQQREAIYSQRRQVLEGENLNEKIMNMIEEVLDNALDLYCDEKVYPEEWDLDSFVDYLENLFLPAGKIELEKIKGMVREEIKETIMEQAHQQYEEKEKETGLEIMRELERVVVLRVVDRKWMSHIDAMDSLRQGIGLRAIGQKNPLVEYKYEAYEMFQQMVKSIREEVVSTVFKVQVVSKPERQSVVKASSTGTVDMVGGDGKKSKPKPRRVSKVKRNDPCPCGSGKKHKKCCGN